MLSYLTDVVIQASSDDGGFGKLGLAFYAAGFVFFGAMYLRYRNTNKREKYEASTKAEIDRVQSSDTYARAVNHQRSSKMSGANNHAVRGARKGLF